MRPKTYSRFAEVYDRLGADRFSVSMVEYTFKLMRKHRIVAHSVLDLCCGTGTAAGLFRQRGLEASGLDGSPQMIAQARKKLAGTGVSLYCQTLPNFRIHAAGNRGRPKRFDLVTCYYDALNYLTTERKLGSAFKAICRHLNPGGWFVFDMNTPEALKTIWSGHIWGGTKEDLAWIWQNEYDEHRVQGKCLSTFFIKKGRHWQRHDEYHVEQGYDNTTIKRLLRESGFVISGFYRCLHFTKPTARTTRICVVARSKR